MSEQKNIYTQRDYGKKPVFSSFLPGIAGLCGIPLWCYYVNRGQGVCAFGSQDKDHAIMEFSPAHVAYQNVKRTGFRTFIKRDGVFAEPFSDENKSSELRIGMNSFSVAEDDPDTRLTVEASYYILPEEPIGALVRELRITNRGEAADIELIDGMPAIVPYGVDVEGLKNMTQTAKAWMQAEDVAAKRPYYRVRSSMQDSAQVTEVEGGNFGLAYTADGERLAANANPELIFSYDTSLGRPVGFVDGDLGSILEKSGDTVNRFPCCMFGLKKHLAAGEQLTIYELYGQSANKEILSGYIEMKRDAKYFAEKKKRAESLTAEMTDVIDTHTANADFDAYCRYSYMDNALRGGIPIRLGNNKVFYVYSRKHGDLERDYNYFSVLPEYFSQGNGNFRDVNQNRRSDVFFHPFVGTENIHKFYSLLQLDGYNPLGIETQRFTLDKGQTAVLLPEIAEDERGEWEELFSKGFTPGELYGRLVSLLDERAETRFYHIMDFAEALPDGDYIEGYWSDHWTYNLDLVEEYLSIYPDRREELLFEGGYTWYLPEAVVNPRVRRYEMTEKGLRQYYAVEHRDREYNGRVVRTDFGKGEPLTSTLAEKLVVLSVLKYAALDADGLGVEMEGGKPGWYDALNGLPGMLGSSMAESCELLRMLDFTAAALKEYDNSLMLPEEFVSLLREANEITRDTRRGFVRWERINDTKERYRETIARGVSGKKESIATKEAADILAMFAHEVGAGIEQARGGDGVFPTYFYYDATDVAHTEDGYMPRHLERRATPDFLEGTVRYMKLPVGTEKKRELYKRVKDSRLYDRKLGMYKVNASLSEASFELGRACAFTSGWLENESVWLHMEYKYLLELLKSGLYEEYFDDFARVLVPFLDEETYGRSILENSSFIASSANPDPEVWGRGFVARLSGSTAEFLNMWRLMLFGRDIFTMEDGELVFSPSPVLPAMLIPEDGVIRARLLGDIDVAYHIEGEGDLIPGNYKISAMQLRYLNGSEAEIDRDRAEGRPAQDIRDGKVSEIDIYLRRG